MNYELHDDDDDDDDDDDEIKGVFPFVRTGLPDRSARKWGEPI